MPRTLYARLALILIALLLAIGLLYALFSLSATRHYLEEVNQHLNRDLAHNLVMDRNLVEQDRINEAALKETFHHYMVINPSIEIYLLDIDGRILSYSADPEKVKRRSVSLQPIRDFLSGGGYPLLGDDPRSHDRQKAFSVTPIPSAEAPQGYLYVVLQGEEFDAINNAVHESRFLRLSAWALAISLVLGLLLGLWVFYRLTRRLHRLTANMEGFRASSFTQHTRYQSERNGKAADEIDQLGQSFDAMAQRIIEQFESLKQEDILRRELVAHVSHDLRTPLTTLHGYLETLQLKDETLTSSERNDYIATALRHSDRLTQLVAELFELARLDATREAPQREPFAITELVHDVAQKFRLRTEQAGVTLQIDIDNETPFVEADISLIERALENLIDNAIDHTPSGGTLTLSVQKRSGEAEVSVRDSGSGIPAAELPRIFDRFYQVNNRHRGGGHAGLGLAIVKRIMELHHSNITVESEPGDGTAFTFMLPAWRP
jgi:signal transduction histidine kinase